MFKAEEATPIEAPEMPVPAPTTPDIEQKYPFRLLKDETVVGTFPVAQKRRPFGKVASFLFVTDSRILYSAEAKSLTSSSTQLKEYQVQTVTGVEATRHRGLDALTTAAALGAVLNFLIMIVISAKIDSSEIKLVLGLLAAASLIVGAAAVAIMARSTAEINVVGPIEPQKIVRSGDIARLTIMILLFVIFGLFIALTVIMLAALRELGFFKAQDSELFVDTKNIDAISYEIGALILDVQARGKFVGKN